MEFLKQISMVFMKESEGNYHSLNLDSQLISNNDF
jgi:hypothetical protein